MDVSQKGFNKQDDEMIIYQKNEKELINSQSDNNSKSNIDEETLNLFKGIVKITKISNSKLNKKPIKKSISANNTQNIFEFTKKLFDNEEHMNKDQICSVKNSENNPHQDEILSPISRTPHNLSSNRKLIKSQSSKVFLINSPERNKNTNPKSLFNKNTINQSNTSLKSVQRKRSLINNKLGDSTHRNRKKYSFFFKMKEKEKNPSKTPYLDKKFFANNSKSINKIMNSDKLLNGQNLFPLIKISNINNKDNSPKKSEIKKNSEKIIFNNESQKEIKPINIISNTNLNVIKESQKNDEIKGNNNSVQNKKQVKTSNNLIINILNKPFFCCLKS